MARSSVARPAVVRGWWLAGIGAVLVLALPISSRLIEEFYSRLVYPRVQGAVTTMSNLVPFAVLDALIVVALMAAGLRLIWLLRAAWHRGPLAATIEGVQRVIRAVSVVVLLFVTAWGCNYRRLPVEETASGEPAPRPTVERLEAAVRQSAALAATLRRAVRAEPERRIDEVAGALEAPMNAALAQLKLPALGAPGRPKTSFVLTQWFTWAGVNGMVNPLGLESIVHPDLLPFERPFVLAHEWAHLAGHADEAEANAIGWFACMHGDATLRYSASLYLLMEGASALPAEPRTRALKRIDPGVREDLAAIAERTRAERPRVRRAASRVYDEYLKANRVEDGTASYSRALHLILSPLMQSGMPVTRP
jgi:hypothetical protein